MNTIRTQKVLGNGKIEYLVDVGTDGSRTVTLTTADELNQKKVDAFIKELDDMEAERIAKEEFEANAIRIACMSPEEKEHLGIT
tara:strand:+ start:340 stop:591 length:252 start_codon:yes stop_codon:yes gene_type:complete